MSDLLPNLIRQANRGMSKIVNTADLRDHPETPQTLQALGDLIGQVQSQLDEPAKREDEQVQKLLPEYKNTLTKMQSLLQLLDSDLRHRHSELREERKRLDSARSWSNRYRTTV